jgi:hypothetical protein
MRLSSASKEEVYLDAGVSVEGRKRRRVYPTTPEDWAEGDLREVYLEKIDCRGKYPELEERSDDRRVGHGDRLDSS